MASFDVAQLNSLFQVIFSSPNLKFEETAHTSLQELHLGTCPGLASKILRALQINTSVKRLGLEVCFEDDVAKEFVGLLSENKSIQEIQVTVTADSKYYQYTGPVTNRNVFITMMESVGNAKHLKKVGIWYPWYNFDYTASIGQAVCKVIRDNTTLRSLIIPLFLPQDESFLQPIAKSLYKNSALQTLILKKSFYFPSELSSELSSEHSIEDDDTFGENVTVLIPQPPEYQHNIMVSHRTELSSEEAEALREMLEVNKSLQIVHLPPDLSDSTCSQIIKGLSANNTIEEFQMNENTRTSAIKCEDYPLVRKKIVFMQPY